MQSGLFFSHCVTPSLRFRGSAADCRPVKSESKFTRGVVGVLLAAEAGRIVQAGSQ